MKMRREGVDTEGTGTETWDDPKPGKIYFSSDA
jgi:hypothetical protein